MQMSEVDGETGFFGKRVAEHFRMQGHALAELRLNDRLGLAATRLSCDRRIRDRTAPAPCEDAFSILFQLDDLECRSCWLDGRKQSSGSVAARAVCISDLRDKPQWEFRGRFDALQFYVPSQALSEVVDRHGARPISRLTWDRNDPDPIMFALSEALLQASMEPGSNRLLIDQLGLSFLTYFAQAYGGLQAPDISRPGRLAPWQERRAKDIMAARLATDLTIAQVADECQLTPSHFARAFRRSTGLAPHRYLMKLRVEEAKRLLAQPHVALSDVALICGFGDQSHFTRVFRQMAGTTPGAWRRELGVPASAGDGLALGAGWRRA